MKKETLERIRMTGIAQDAVAALKAEER